MRNLLNAVAFAAVIGTSMPALGADIHAMVSAAAAAHGIPRSLAHAVATVESNYNCGLRGGAGERGIMQVKPATARSVGVTGNLFDCATGLKAGMLYLRIALARGGRGCAGVSLYQRGVYGRPGCTAYGRKVMALAARRGAVD